ncbi:MAG: DUF305 domain-containing protein [Agriterribacter sp.]
MKHEHSKHEATAPAGHQKHGNHYKHLVIMTLLSFVAMYILMYSMVDKINNVFPNVNQLYMAGLMAMPMLIFEMIVMRSMYVNKKLNAVFLCIAIIGMIGFYVCIRQQAAVSDKQFLKSMIPHHAGAILMCEQSDIKDPEIIKLCETIRSGQQQEIEQMKAKLEELNNK